MKRFFDIVFSSAGLILLAPLFVLVAIAVKVGSKGPVFYRQERIGKDFKPFKIYKFRTMVEDADRDGSLVTVSGDRRITRVGKILRKYKIDELPQLINVLKGDMSLVGPRPEVRRYVELFKPDYQNLLKVRPGITDPASITFSHEEKLLSISENWEEHYVNSILPEKIKLSSRYVENHGILKDFKLIVDTLMKTSQVR